MSERNANWKCSVNWKTKNVLYDLHRIVVLFSLLAFDKTVRHVQNKLWWQSWARPDLVNDVGKVEFVRKRKACAWQFASFINLSSLFAKTGREAGKFVSCIPNLFLRASDPGAWDMNCRFSN